MLTYCVFDLLFTFLLKSSQHSSNKALDSAKKVLVEVFLFPYADRCIVLPSCHRMRCIVYAHSHLPL